ncbi:unnamed protein product [Rhizophagus irregularis]|nr:unnamed protein product [Rhizophagus irregularis]
MPRQIHEYFDSKSTNWSILGFLEECDEEPFQKKIDKYIKDLEIIADYEQGKRQEQANLLLSRYREDSQPDFKLARKWEKERSRKQVHYHQPTITDINGNMTGNIGTITGGSFVVGSKRKQEESDDDFQPPKTPSTKKLSLPKKNKEPVKSTASKKAKTTIKNVEDEDDDPFISPSSSSRGGTSSINTPKYYRSSFPMRNRPILDAVYDNSEASSSSIYTDIEQEQQTDSILLSDADMKSYCEAYSNMNPHHMWTLKSGRKVEQVIYEFGKNLHHESYLHSFIINDADKTTKNLFSDEEWEEITNSEIKPKPKLEQSQLGLLKKYTLDNTENLRKVLAEPFVSKFDRSIHFDLDFINFAYRSMLFLWEAED